MDKATMKNFGLTVGAVAVGVLLVQIVIGPMVSRMLAPKISNVQA